MISSRKIPFLDLATPHVELEEELVSVFKEALNTGGFIGGPMVNDFEREFAQFCEVSHCVGVNSGTDALRFCLIAAGARHLNGYEDVAFITVYFPHNIIAHVNVNWLSPVKVRTTLIGGEKKMLVWNDLEADEKIKVYDKGVQITNGKGVHELLISYRAGDMWAPKVEPNEALKAELGYFIDCVSNNETPFNDGVAGLRVVKMLEAADKSVREKGALIRL